MLTMLADAVETLLAYDNAELQFFMADRDVISDLDNYADHIHVAGRVTYRLAEAIKKSQKRANALKNIVIPSFDTTIRTITEALEEKEREEFVRLKVIKRQNESRKSE